MIQEPKIKNLKEAVNRLKWRFSESKQFNIKETDVDAFNFLVDWINTQQKETKHDQQLFAKLYTHVFTETLTRTQNLAESVREMKNLCKLSLSYFTDNFHFRFNVLKYWMYCEQKNIPIMHEKYQSKEDRDLIMWHIENDEAYKKHLLGYWSKEKVEASITNEILEAIHEHKQLP